MHETRLGKSFWASFPKKTQQSLDERHSQPVIGDRTKFKTCHQKASNHINYLFLLGSLTLQKNFLYHWQRLTDKFGRLNEEFLYRFSVRSSVDGADFFFIRAFEVFLDESHCFLGVLGVNRNPRSDFESA